MEKKALIFDIEKFAVHDGPGIRTVVFLKGCPLRCVWCHNPESHSMKEELFFRSEKCINCQACARACPDSCHIFQAGKHLFLREKCSVCGRCAEVCPAEVLQKAGEEMSVNEVMEKVLEDQVFYQYSGGGVTLSGGEPLFQADFTLAFLQQAKKHGIHTCVETSGYASGEILEQVAELVDLFLWDVKAESFSHRELTGVEDTLILQNLQRIGSLGAEFHLRCPVIIGLNDTEAFFRKIAKLSVTYPTCRKIELEPYHPLGEEKSRHLGRTPQYCGTFAEKDPLQEHLDLLRSLTDTEIIVHGI